ncbi:MAG: polysaccharide deacetylase family protein [Chitinophagales bacterium]|nr:polysaccharide deacetylase family protein [Chitinophagales bacterium]MDW8394108.1 polysaccharide deacetylase family protein [Chitinophagales bacterium]
MPHSLRSAAAWILCRLGTTALLRKWRGNSITVLCLHRINEETHHVWPSMHVSVFRNLLDYIRRHYRVCSIGSELYEGSGPKMVLTFDDGYYDFIEYVLPLLHRYRLPAIHHVTADSVLSGRPNWTYLLNLIVDDFLKSKKTLEIEEIKYSGRIALSNAQRESLYLFHRLKRFPHSVIEQIIHRLMNQCTGDLYLPRMMQRDDLLDCCASGVQIGAHGFYHLVLHEDLPADQMHREILESKQQLEQVTGRPVTSFSFVNGEFIPSAIELCGAAGYSYLFTTEERFVGGQPVQAPYPWIFPRLLVPSSGAFEAYLYVEGFHSFVRSYGRSAHRL